MKRPVRNLSSISPFSLDTGMNVHLRLPEGRQLQPKGKGEWGRRALPRGGHKRPRKPLVGRSEFFLKVKENEAVRAKTGNEKASTVESCQEWTGGEKKSAKTFEGGGEVGFGSSRLVPEGDCAQKADRRAEGGDIVRFDNRVKIS